jgi:hypothetical protein
MAFPGFSCPGTSAKGKIKSAKVPAQKTRGPKNQESGSTKANRQLSRKSESLKQKNAPAKLRTQTKKNLKTYNLTTQSTQN